MSAPVINTCPDIDKVIDSVEKAMINARDIDRTLDKVESIMEELRSANSSLRTWGYELESELKDKDDEINKLESEIEDLKDYIKQLETELNTVQL